MRYGIHTAAHDELAAANAYALTLVTNLAKRFPAVPTWQPLDDLMGKLTQIDNMTARCEPEAWFFYCWRPGKHCWWASVDKDDKDWWPTDDWKVVRRIALSKSGEWETLHGSASDLPKAIRTQADAEPKP